MYIYIYLGIYIYIHISPIINQPLAVTLFILQSLVQEGKACERDQVENTLHDEDYEEPPSQAIQEDINDICNQMAPPVETGAQLYPESQGADQIVTAPGEKETCTLGDPIPIDSDDDEDDWTLEDCIEFAQQWSSVDEMKQNRPSNITQPLWKAILDVYDLCCEYGPNPQHILGHMEARAKGLPYDPDSNVTPPTISPNYELSRAEGLGILRDCGFSDEIALGALQLTGNDVAAAIEIATAENLGDRAATGEFGPPEVAVPIVEQEKMKLRKSSRKDTTEIIDELQPHFDSQIDAERHGHMIEQAREAHQANDHMNIDAVETLPYHPEVFDLDGDGTPDGEPTTDGNGEPTSDSDGNHTKNMEWIKCLAGVEARKG